MLLSLLTLGFLLGVRHALEADHVAAVASLATRSSSPSQTARLAAAWGAGHAVMLILVGGLVVTLGWSLPVGLARVFEAAAGLLLVVLGIDVLRRLRHQSVHFHVHRHDGGIQHLHAHAHAGEPAGAHDPAAHRHEHPKRLLLRALLVGSVHGVAGSAALVVLSLQAVSSSARALAYIVVFGAGAVAGMILFSLVIAMPLRVKSRHLERASRHLETALGAASVLIGTWIAVNASLGY
jgi:cytochrome c biogenesis protein CcdA